MTVAEAITAFLKEQGSATRAEIIAGVTVGTPASRWNMVTRMTDRGDLRVQHRRRRTEQGRLAKVYMLQPSREWSDADQRLVEEYEQREREALTVRRCLCCRSPFTTVESYRLCVSCRKGEIVATLFADAA